MKSFFDQKTINVVVLSFLLFILGFLFFAFYNNWIILFLPSYNIETISKKHSFKKERVDVSLAFWKDNKWNKESINLLWCEADQADNIKYLINGWLNLVREEKVLFSIGDTSSQEVGGANGEFNLKKEKAFLPAANLQNVLISSCGQNAYLSFDRNPLPQECSIYQKLMFIEGILKTIRENGVKVSGIFFLVKHKTMQDQHFDFSRPWPVSGFVS